MDSLYAGADPEILAQSCIARPFVIRLVPDLDPGLIAGRLVENPKYSVNHEPITGFSIAEWEPAPYIQQTNPEFFLELEKSIMEHGVINPICAFSFEAAVYAKTGMSRLLICKRLGMTVPAIVSDWCGRFADCEELENPLTALKATPEYQGFSKAGWYYTHLSDRDELPPCPKQK